MIPGHRPEAVPATASTRAATCPDCAAPQAGQGMVHADSCPIGAGVDRATDADRRWFERHPRATERVRRVTWAEAAEIELSAGWRPSGTVRVLHLAPGVRSRYFEEGEAR